MQIKSFFADQVLVRQDIPSDILVYRLDFNGNLRNNREGQTYLLTRILNNFGNVLLLPVRFLLDGRKVECLVKRGRIIHSRSEANERSSLKVMIAVALFFPSLVLGSVIKGSALVMSKNLREVYSGIPSDLNLEEDIIE